MTRLSWRQALGLAAAALVLAGAAADAQYFGRNKVQYDEFDFRIAADRPLRHSLLSRRVAGHALTRPGMAERWYSRLSDVHSPPVRPQVDHLLRGPARLPADERRSAVATSEGTGGVTEGFRTRVVMPFTGSYDENHHVLGHEIVHVFQYDIAEAGPAGITRLSALPLWLIEGMAEYLSIGREDPHTAMWLRDAALRDDLPTIKQLNTDPRYFPYRYGQALWAYVGGRWGDRAVIDVFRTALRVGLEGAFRRVLGMTSDSLSKDWIAATRARVPAADGRAHAARRPGHARPRHQRRRRRRVQPRARDQPRRTPRRVLLAPRAVHHRPVRRRRGDRPRDQAARPARTRDAHFDAISFIQSAGSWSPDGKKLAFVVYRRAATTRSRSSTWRRADVERRVQCRAWARCTSRRGAPTAAASPSPASAGGISDLYLLDLRGRRVRRS